MFGMVYSTGSAKRMPSTGMCSWRCLVAYIGKLSANPADREDENMRVSGEMLEMERVDADLYRQGRDDDLRAMQDNGLTLEIPITEAVGGKHIQGFAIAHVQEANVTGVGTGLGKDNHQGTPPLMIASATLSRASSWFRDRGAHEGRIREWCVRAAFFNADLDCARASWTQRVSTWSLLVAAESFVWDKNALTRNGESGTETSCDGLGWLGVSEKRLRLRFTRQRPGDASAECHCDDFVAEARLIWMSCYDGSSK